MTWQPYTEDMLAALPEICLEVPWFRSITRLFISLSFSPPTTHYQPGSSSLQLTTQVLQEIHQRCTSTLGQPQDSQTLGHCLNDIMGLCMTILRKVGLGYLIEGASNSASTLASTSVSTSTSLTPESQVLPQPRPPRRRPRPRSAPTPRPCTNAPPPTFSHPPPPPSPSSHSPPPFPSRPHSPPPPSHPPPRPHSHLSSPLPPPPPTQELFSSPTIDLEGSPVITRCLTPPPARDFSCTFQRRRMQGTSPVLHSISEDVRESRESSTEAGKRPRI